MSLQSTFSAPFGGDANKKLVGGVYDRSPESPISKPRDMGPDAQPERFFEEMPGAKNGTKVESTMGTAIEMNGGTGGSGSTGTTISSTFDAPFGKK